MITIIDISNALNSRLPPKKVQNQSQAVVVSYISEPVTSILQLVLTGSKTVPTNGALSPLTPLKLPTYSQAFVVPQPPRQSPKAIPAIAVAVPPYPDRQFTIVRNQAYTYQYLL